MMLFMKNLREPVTWSWCWIEKFPAIDIQKSGTRREDLLLNKEEQDAVYIIRKAMNGMKADEAVDNLLNMFSRTRTNAELVQTVIRQKFI